MRCHSRKGHRKSLLLLQKDSSLGQHRTIASQKSVRHEVPPDFPPPPKCESRTMAHSLSAVPPTKTPINSCPYCRRRTPIENLFRNYLGVQEQHDLSR